jgi:hypothetical protein
MLPAAMVEIQSTLANRARPRAFARRPDVTAAALAGGFAGAFLLFTLMFLSVSIYDEAPWKLPRMIAATIRGPEVLQPADEFDFAIVGLGIGLHFALSLLYAFALLGLIIDVKRWTAPYVGLAFGVALYFVNLYGFTQLFPWFAELRTADTLAAHAIFGLLVARAYWAFTARSSP